MDRGCCDGEVVQWRKGYCGVGGVVIRVDVVEWNSEPFLE